MNESLDPSQCFACSPENLRGLHLLFHSDAAGQWAAEWTPEADLVGFRGVVHGGIVSTVLDESMAKAVAGTGTFGYTAELRVRFREPVPPGAVLQVRGWIAERSRRMVKTEAFIQNSSGEELAHAWATFLIAH
jgi:acyl-coenzyme A thioesterase PaaI-like protein